MTNSSINTQQMWVDFEALPTAAISLSSEAINRAVELSSQIPEESRQWQTYLNALALFGFEEWLQERAELLTVNQENCTVLQPAIANAIAAVANLQIDEFKLCLITTGSLSDEDVTLPRAVVDLPEFAAHFYVLVEVLEEQESIFVRGFLSYQQLVERRANFNLVADEDWTYQVPLTWFEEEPDSLLLYLRCLDSEAIVLPAVPTNRAEALARIQNQLTALMPQLQSPERELWQVLNWQQGTAVLTNPQLLNWVYKIQRQEDVSALNTQDSRLRTSLSDLFKLVTQPAVNVGRWLWDELDELAQELSWELLPNLAPAGAIRTVAEEFNAITTQLQDRGLEIPSQARGAYQDLLLSGIPIRLYAVIWPMASESDPYWWSLLLILGSPFETSLPHDLKLRVSDQNGILLEREFQPEQDNSYLFTRVVGSWNEKFLVSVSVMNGIEVTLPPFAFYSGRGV